VLTGVFVPSKEEEVMQDGKNGKDKKGNIVPVFN
jgi:hypothetical protein